MPLIPTSNTPDSFWLAVWEIKPEEFINTPESLFRLKKCFPERTITELNESRIQEHFAVISAIDSLLLTICGHLKEVNQNGNIDWHIQHNNKGAPSIFINHLSKNLSLSITHAKSNEGSIIAVVAMTDIPGYRLGVDLAFKSDARIKRIANRVFCKKELESCKSDSDFALIWACKEAMFKANGPNIDFANDLLVHIPAQDNSLTGFVKGAKSMWWNLQISNQDGVIVAGPI